MQIAQTRASQPQRNYFALPSIHADYREMIASDGVDVTDCCFGHEPARAEARLDVIRAAGWSR